jgi:hypothetical protein
VNPYNLVSIDLQFNLVVHEVDVASTPSILVEDEVDHIDLQTILHALEHSGCVNTTVGWWSYEICPFDNVKQFHLTSDGVVAGESYVLGRWDSQSEPHDRHLNVEAMDQHWSERFVRTHMAGGSVCGKHGMERRVVMEYACTVTGTSPLVVESVIEDRFEQCVFPWY